MYRTLLYFAWVNQRHRQCYIQSTINQLKHGKGRAIRVNGTRGVVSIDHCCAYSTSFCALTNTRRLVVSSCLLNKSAWGELFYE